MKRDDDGWIPARQARWAAQTSDRRRATEILVEERAAARDPEHAGGTPPDA